MATENLRHLYKQINVDEVDAAVATFFFTGSKEERAAADQILRYLQANSEMWNQVYILQNTKSMDTKFFALQVLEGVIKYRWNALPVEQRDGMRKYILEVIVQLSSNEASLRSERLYLNKLNVILVQIVKHYRPAGWTSFIPSLVGTAKTSTTICENCMAILQLLSEEEVFDFSSREMTLQNSEFELIQGLFKHAISQSETENLREDSIRSTLNALLAYLPQMHMEFIFSFPLLESLLKFIPRTSGYISFQCLTVVIGRQFEGTIVDNTYITIFLMLIGKLEVLMKKLQVIFRAENILKEAYSRGALEDQAFVQNMALFFTSFFKFHIRLLETDQIHIGLLLEGLEYLIKISYVDAPEVFKVCLDYWKSLVLELCDAHHNSDNPAVSASLMRLQMSGMVDPQVMQRRQIYSNPMSKLRGLMINRMANPEEVLIVEDGNGNIARETMKDNDVLVQYKIMRETLIYLSILDHDDTEKQISEKLKKLLSEMEWAQNDLNALCWAIGSISGSMAEDQEDRFLVMVIHDLLKLCEYTEEVNKRAVVLSNIMYVVGQYPRFLRKFLKTVVNKLEFMHETHPGVQDMAYDTFLKIFQKCKSKFVLVQVGENEPFVSELLSGLATTVYESVGNMIQAEPDPQKRVEYIQRLMALPNQKWAEIIRQARQSGEFLKDPVVIRTVLNILQTNTSAATSLGTYFLSQISLIFLDMLNVYGAYSELVSSSITDGGPYASKTSSVKLFRSVKRETLKLIETFLDKAEDQPHIVKQFVPPMMESVLGDYTRNVPDARESEVLSLFTTIINKYKATMLEGVPRIFEAVFQCTLEMIHKNFEDYPEHRLKFFSLLRAIATFCFPALTKLSSQQLKLVMDTIIWAFKHTERNIAETGLNLLLEMLKNFQESEFSNQFFRSYFIQIEQEIFAVLTNPIHKHGFKLHVLVLQQLFCVVESGSLTEPLWDAATVPYPYPNNATYVREYTIKLLSSSFLNMTAAEVTQFVDGLYQSGNIRDFLDLYALSVEEAAAQREQERQRMLSIPGLRACFSLGLNLV